MRLTGQQVAAIREGVRACFGSHAAVWLFGSRVNDDARGGDIDLYVEPEMDDPDMLIRAKLRFLAQLHRTIGEQKIDVVLRRVDSSVELPIYQEARAEGIRLA